MQPYHQIWLKRHLLPYVPLSSSHFQIGIQCLTIAIVFELFYPLRAMSSMWLTSNNLSLQFFRNSNSPKQKKWATLTYNKFISSDDAGLNKKTGEYSAPRSGIYQFHFHGTTVSLKKLPKQIYQVGSNALTSRATPSLV